MKLNKHLLAIILSSWCLCGYAQEKGSFAVVTFEIVVKHHVFQTYNWITNKDSSELRLYPFFLTESLFTPEMVNTQEKVEYLFASPVDENYDAFLSDLVRTIKNNRTKVQSIKIKSYTNPEYPEFDFDETINIYLSFFHGSVLTFPFYSLFRFNRMGKDTPVEFEGTGYIPLFDFSPEEIINENFKTRLFRHNYALFPFDYYLPDYERPKPTDHRNSQIKMNRDAKRTVPLWNVYD